MTAIISTKALLKTYFETNDIPTQSEFDGLITTIVGMVGMGTIALKPLLK